MGQAQYRHGHVTFVDHTPGADVAAGDVIVIGNCIRIAHSDIKSGVLGALAAGGGIYEVPKASGGGSAIANGASVFWDDTNNVITTTASTHKRLGIAVGASLDADTKQLIQHVPYST